MALDDPPPLSEEASIENTLDLRVASVFVIFFAGCLGGFPPLFMKVRKDPEDPEVVILHLLHPGKPPFTQSVPHCLYLPRCCRPCMEAHILLMNMTQIRRHSYLAHTCPYRTLMVCACPLH